MKKIISVALATLLVLSAVFTVPMVFADEVLSITNTYEVEGLGSLNSGGEGTHKLNGKYIFHLGEKSAAEREGRVLQFSAISGKTNIAKGNITYVEIYNPNDANFASFKPEVGKTYQITFDFKTQVWSNDISFNIRGVKNTGIGDILVNAVTIAAKDPAYTGKYVWGTATTSVTITEDLKALAISIEIDKDANGNAYPYLDNIVLTEVKDEEPEVPECEHATTKDVITTPATYFTTGLKNVVCADEACGAVVEENVAIERITANPITYEYSYNAKAAALTIDGTFSDALVLDMVATNGAKFALNYTVAGKNYKAENIAVAKDDEGVKIVIAGFNKARLGKVDFDLEISWDGAVGTAYTDNAAEFNTASKGSVDVTNLITGEDNTAYDAFEEAIVTETEKEIGTTADANNAFMNNSYKVNLAEGSAVLKFSLNDALRKELSDRGGYEAAGRVVTLKVKIGENTYSAEIEELRVHITVKITGLSFTHMNSDISAWLEFTYDETENNFTTLENAVEYSGSAIVADAAETNAIAAAFKDLMN